MFSLRQCQVRHQSLGVVFFQLLYLRFGCFAIFVGSLMPMYALADGIESADKEHTAGNGSLAIAYQTIRVNKFNTSAAEVDIGEALTHSVYIEGSYAITDRWLLTVGIPWVTKKYNGHGRMSHSSTTAATTVTGKTSPLAPTICGCTNRSSSNPMSRS